MLRLKRMRTMLSTTAANIAPMQGEISARAVPHLLLVRSPRPAFAGGRRSKTGRATTTSRLRQVRVGQVGPAPGALRRPCAVRAQRSW